MNLFRVICVDTFEAAHDPKEAEYESFAGTDEAIVLQWAQQKLVQLEDLQPTETSGGQGPHGIQDRVFIERPDGTRYRVLPPTDEAERIQLFFGKGR
jgi:hypothetical protein